MVSTLPNELMVTRPLASAMQLALVAPADLTRLKVVFWAAAVKLAKASTRQAASGRFTVFISLLLRIFSLCPPGVAVATSLEHGARIAGWSITSHKGIVVFLCCFRRQIALHTTSDFRIARC
jgi:hypothetical protein